MDRCLETSSLSLYARGGITTAERADIESHLSSCAGCKHAVAALLRELPQTVSLPGASLAAASPVSVPNPPQVPGYDVLRPLGRGGMGVVYEARQKSSGALVALKTVRSTAPDAVAALRREVQVLRTVSHPGVTRLLGDGMADSFPYFVMSLVQGVSLCERFTQAAPRPPSVDARMLTLLRRVCSTLSVLHGRGLVHRDVNPRNILLHGEDRPVLVDFGLAARFAAVDGRDELDFGGVTMGTLAYAAPEQLRGELVDPRADLYAIGCILYELLTGRLPFVATSQRALIEAHLYETPVSPSAYAEVPGELARLTLRLLAKRPRDRVGYAHEVGDVLGALGAEDWPAPHGGKPSCYVYRPELVGRKGWLVEAERLIARCCTTGHGARVFIAGESGAGKTRLLAEIATVAARNGMSVITAECAAMSGSDTHVRSARATSLQALRPLLREVADRCRAEPALTDSLLGARGPLLAAYEPSLLGIVPQSAPGPVTPDSAHQRLLTCLRDTLSALCRTAPVLLIFDDLQWMDHLSFEFLSTLSHELLERRRLLIIGAYRANEAGPAITEAAHTTHRRLARLSPESIAAMAGSMLAMDRLPEQLSERLLAQAQGNPLFAAEFLRMAVSSGWLVRRDGDWKLSGSLASSPSLRAPLSLKQVIALRLNNLTPRAREVVEVASVLGRSFERGELLTASSLAQHETLEALDELVARQVLEEAARGQVRFVHDKVPETIYAALSNVQRRALHAQVVKALEASSRTQEAKADRYAELAFHWHESGEPEQAALYWAHAGSRALRATAYADAVEHYQAALRSALDAPRLYQERRLLARWQRGLGEAYYGAGDTEQSDLYLRQSLTGFGLSQPSDRSQTGRMLRRELIKQLAYRVHGGRSESAALSLEERSEAALAAERLAFIRLWKMDSLATMACTLLAGNLIDELGSDKPTTRPYSLLGFMAGIARIRPLERRYFRLARERQLLVHDSDYVYSVFLECFLRAGECAWARADSLKHQGLRLIGPQQELIARDATAIFGFTERARGNYAAAREHAHALRAAAREADNAEHEIWSEVLEASCHLRVQRYTTAREHLERAVELLREKPEWVCELRAYGQLAHAHFGMGHRSHATGLADHALELLRAHRGPPLMAPAVDAVMSLTHVYLELWRESAPNTVDSRTYEARAREALGHLAKLALVFPLARPYWLLCAGRLCTHHGHSRPAAILFELARRSAAAYKLPYEQALGCWHRARHAPTRAARELWLARAQVHFAAIGCALPSDELAPG